jgi:hypothetical protein
MIDVSIKEELSKQDNSPKKQNAFAKKHIYASPERGGIGGFESREV